MFAFSPGLMSDEEVQWSLVAVNPFQGNVSKVCDIGPPGWFLHLSNCVYLNIRRDRAKSVDPDQTAPLGAVCSMSTLFVNYLIEF